MRVAVKDACVLIDLANGGLIDAWFQLGIETHTTDLVIRQIKDEAQWQIVSGYVQAGLIKVQSLSGDQMAQLYREMGNLTVGIEDKSVLFLALEIGAILLTGDRKVRVEGLRRELEVRGVLWILDELIAKKKLSPRLAAEKLKLMLKAGAYLPQDECQKRLAEWEAVS